MFDLFGISRQEVFESARSQVVLHTALVLLLIDKGVITEEEYSKAQSKATHIVDQLLAKRTEETEKEFDEQHPGLRDLARKLLGDQHD